MAQTGDGEEPPRTVYLVRHGETPWTATGRTQGWAPVPLTDTGEEQMQATGEYLAEQATTEPRVVTSDLRRAKESARIVRGQLGQSPVLETDPTWRERDFGVYQGLGEELDGDLEAEAADDRLAHTPESGESLRAVERRVLTAWQRLRTSLAPSRDAIVVTHTGPLYSLMAAINGQPLADQAVDFDVGGVIELTVPSKGGPATVARRCTPWRDESG